MGNQVLVVDCSGSMRNVMSELKETLHDEWLSFHLTEQGPNKIAIVAFGNDVHIKTHYTDDLTVLQDHVMSLSSGCCGGGMTSLWDALITSLVFDDPQPDIIYVWTDGSDTQSNATQNDYETLANSLGVPIIFEEIPYYWWDNDQVVYLNARYKPLLGETLMLRAEYEVSLNAMASIKNARINKAPQPYSKN